LIDSIELIDWIDLINTSGAQRISQGIGYFTTLSVQTPSAIKNSSGTSCRLTASQYPKNEVTH
jgi:hypothetical protein